MIKANEYRTVTCGELREENIGQQVRVAGWVENIRDHGGVMFLDIRDQYGVLQVVVHNDELLKDINKECTVALSDSFADYHISAQQDERNGLYGDSDSYPFNFISGGRS